MLSGWVDVSGDGWGGCSAFTSFGAAGVPLKIGCLTTSSRFFFERPAHAGRTLTVKGLSSNRRSSLYDLADALARGANRAGDLGLCEA